MFHALLSISLPPLHMHFPLFLPPSLLTSTQPSNPIISPSPRAVKAWNSGIPSPTQQWIMQSEWLIVRRERSCVRFCVCVHVHARTAPGAWCMTHLTSASALMPAMLPLSPAEIHSTSRLTMALSLSTITFFIVTSGGIMIHLDHTIDYVHLKSKSDCVGAGY